MGGISPTEHPSHRLYNHYQGQKTWSRCVSIRLWNIGRIVQPFMAWNSFRARLKRKCESFIHHALFDVLGGNSPRGQKQQASLKESNSFQSSWSSAKTFSNSIAKVSIPKVTTVVHRVRSPPWMPKWPARCRSVRRWNRLMVHKVGGACPLCLVDFDDSKLDRRGWLAMTSYVVFW